MPLKRCRQDNKPGWKYGDNGACYTYTPGDKDSENKAKVKASKQGVAIDGPEGFRREQSKSEAEGRDDLLAIMQLTLAEQKETTLAKISTQERKDLPASDFGWPQARKFPITDQNSLDAATKLIGHAPPSKQAVIRRNIKRIAARKNLTLPQTWLKD